METKIENKKLLIKQDVTPYWEHNHKSYKFIEIPLEDIKEIISIVGPRMGYKGILILSKEKGGCRYNGFDIEQKILLSYGSYDRQANGLYDELQKKLDQTHILFTVLQEK